jgi:hypothetical protein
MGGDDRVVWQLAGRKFQFRHHLFSRQIVAGPTGVEGGAQAAIVEFEGVLCPSVVSKPAEEVGRDRWNGEGGFALYLRFTSYTYQPAPGAATFV